MKAKKNKEKTKNRKVGFSLFRKEGTVAEPWATAEELLEISKSEEFKKDVKVIKEIAKKRSDVKKRA